MNPRILCHQPAIILKEIFENTTVFQDQEFLKRFSDVYTGEKKTEFMVEDTTTKDGSFYEGKVYNKEMKEVFSSRRSSDMTLFLFKTVYQS